MSMQLWFGIESPQVQQARQAALNRCSLDSNRLDEKSVCTMFPNTSDLSVMGLHESATLMIHHAWGALTSGPNQAFESGVKSISPGCGYSLECQAKLGFILDHYVRHEEVPSDKDIRSFADGVYYLRGQETKSMRGHHVEQAVRDLAQQNPKRYAELENLLADPFHEHTLRTVTAFHAFTRYAWVDDLRGDDRDIYFDASVFLLQQILLNRQPSEIRQVASASRDHHEATFLPTIAEALVEITIALTLGLCRTAADGNGTVLARSFIRNLHRAFPDQLQELLGVSASTQWEEETSGAWGTYRF